MLYVHIFSWYCIGTVFDLLDIIKQWPNLCLCLLPMCTINAGISIMSECIALLQVTAIQCHM